MTRYLYIDTETRSSVNLHGTTVDKYVSAHDFACILITYAVDDDPIEVVEPFQADGSYDIPEDLRRMLTSPEYKKVIHNAPFDLAVFERLGIPIIPHTQIIDTSVQAKAHGLPASLKNLSAALGLEEEAKKSGTLLINYFSKPDKETGLFRTKQDNPEKWGQFIEYAIYDIVALRAAHKLLPNWNYPDGLENLNYYHNRVINRRGLRIDIPFVSSAARQYKAYTDGVSREFRAKYGFYPSQNLELREHLRQYYPDLADVQKATLETLTDPRALEIVEIKRRVSNATPKKYAALLKNVVGDRIRGTLNFMGAAKTGRDSGRVFQPQNLKRSQLFSHIKDEKEVDAAIEAEIQNVKDGKYTHELGSILSELVRNVIIPSPGQKMVVADLANIEGRTLAYLAGQNDKVGNFFKQDRGELEYDNYILAYANTMGVNPASVTKEQRAIGKVMELSLGYGGGINAFKTFFDNSGMSYDDLSKRVREGVQGASWSDRRYFQQMKVDWAGKYFANLDHARACLYLIHKWREKHKAISQFWGHLELAYKHTCRTGESVEVGHLQFSYTEPFLRIRLPSGRLLCYFKATPNLEYTAPDSFTGVAPRIKTYGGKLAENVASGMARDILYANVRRVEQAGYKTIMLVHDEVITEAPDNEAYSAEKLASLLASPIDWAPNFPLSAAGFEGPRYKDK